MKKRPTPYLKDDDIVRANRNIGLTRNYGGTGFTIAKNLGIPKEQGDSVYEAYFKAFPKLKQYFTLVQNAAIVKGYILIDEVTHRKSYFRRPFTPKETHAIYKKALNYPKMYGALYSNVY